MGKTGLAFLPSRQTPTKWCERAGIIYFTVTSDGTTGPAWIERLERQGYRLSDDARSILCSPDFKPTSGVTTEVAILKGERFENEDPRSTEVVRRFAATRSLSAPNAEVACLIREYFSDEDMEAMGLMLVVVMHEPIENADGYPHLLGANSHVLGGRWLSAFFGHPEGEWIYTSGFAFAVV